MDTLEAIRMRNVFTPALVNYSVHQTRPSTLTNLNIYLNYNQLTRLQTFK